MKFFARICTLFVLILTTYVSFAALPKSSGVYAEGGVGLGVTSDDMKAKFNDFSKWFGAQIGVGYKINMFLGVQADLLDYPNFDLSDSKTSKDNWAYDVVAKAIMPFDNGVNVFAKAGWIKLSQKLSGSTVASQNGKNTASTWVFGAGVSLFTDQSLGFTLQAMMTPKVKTIPERFLTTLGVTYIF